MKVVKLVIIAILILSTITALYVFILWYTGIPKPPLTPNSPFPMAFKSDLWGDMTPNCEVIASANQTQYKPLEVDFIYTYHVNGLGFRGSDYVLNEDIFKVLLLGDGYIFGTGLNEGQDIASQLNSMLRNDYPQGSILAFNGGQPGSTITDELDYIREKGSLFKPNLVVVNVSFDDVWEIRRPVITRRMNKSRNIFYKLYIHFRWGKDLYIFKDTYLKRTGLSEEDGLNTLIPDYMKLAVSFKEYVAGWGGDVLFILAESRESMQLKRAMKKAGLKFVYIGAPQNIRVNLPDGHWTDEMSRFVAKKIKEWITEKVNCEIFQIDH